MKVLMTGILMLLAMAAQAANNVQVPIQWFGDYPDGVGVVSVAESARVFAIEEGIAVTFDNETGDLTFLSTDDVVLLTGPCAEQRDSGWIKFSLCSMVDGTLLEEFDPNILVTDPAHDLYTDWSSSGQDTACVAIGQRVTCYLPRRDE